MYDIRFRTMPCDPTAATMDKYLVRLQNEAKALRLAVRVCRTRGDAEAERHARSSLADLQRRIRQLKQEVAADG